jgi:hypothetical protein
MIICGSVKGGSGTSVVAAALAWHSAKRSPTVLVDADGDQPSILGIPDPGVGLEQWMGADAVGRASVDRLLVGAAAFSVLAAGSTAGVRLPASALRSELQDAWKERTVVADVGTRLAEVEWAEGDVSVAVVRPCYLSMRRLANERPSRLDGVVVVMDAGRIMTARDVEAVAGAPVWGVLGVQASVARAIDAGRFDGNVRRWRSSLDRVLDRCEVAAVDA